VLRPPPAPAARDRSSPRRSGRLQGRRAASGCQPRPAGWPARRVQGDGAGREGPIGRLEPSNVSQSRQTSASTTANPIVTRPSASEVCATRPSADRTRVEVERSRRRGRRLRSIPSTAHRRDSRSPCGARALLTMPERRSLEQGGRALPSRDPQLGRVAHRKTSGSAATRSAARRAPRRAASRHSTSGAGSTTPTRVDAILQFRSKIRLADRPCSFEHQFAHLRDRPACAATLARTTSGRAYRWRR